MLPYLNKHRKSYEIVISYNLKNVRMITTWWFEANNLGSMDYLGSQGATAWVSQARDSLEYLSIHASIYI